MSGNGGPGVVSGGESSSACPDPSGARSRAQPTAGGHGRRSPVCTNGSAVSARMRYTADDKPCARICGDRDRGPQRARYDGERPAGPVDRRYRLLRVPATTWLQGGSARLSCCGCQPLVPVVQNLRGLRQHRRCAAHVHPCMGLRRLRCAP